MRISKALTLVKSMKEAIDLIESIEVSKAGIKDENTLQEVVELKKDAIINLEEAVDLILDQ
tara:strand:- start:388 stop:570 length:183 start_codon:yes stop_codon:yes gene_type:complete